MSYILQTARLTKNIGGKTLVSDVDLHIRKGEIYGFLGPNGAGKTTMLSILSAQNPATEGKVVLDGKQVWENPQALEHIYFSREIQPNSSANSSGLKVKDYLKISVNLRKHSYVL